MATLLVITVLLPLVGSLALVLMPRTNDQRARTIALGIALATLAFSLVLLAGFHPRKSATAIRLRRRGRPIRRLLGRELARHRTARYPVRPRARRHQSLAVRPDLAPDDHGDLLASWESINERVALHYAFLLALQTGLLGLFASLDIILFYIFFEFTLIPLFFLIGLWGGPQASGPR